MKRKIAAPKAWRFVMKNRPRAKPNARATRRLRNIGECAADYAICVNDNIGWCQEDHCDEGGCDEENQECESLGLKECMEHFDICEGHT